MTLDEFGLTEIVRSPRHANSDQIWGFSVGDVRLAFKSVYAPGRNYVLFQTVVNPVAVSELGKYVASRVEMGSPWEIRRIQAGDKPVYVPGARDHNNGLKFGNSLMDCYFGAVHKLAEGNIGKESFASYPIVSTSGVHLLYRDPKAIFWPRNFMVVDHAYHTLKKVINDLSGDVAFELMKEQQSPQFYHMAEIQVLHDAKIAPLLINSDRILETSVWQLGMFVDLLCPMVESYRNTSCPID